jgi:hypothetical protein
VIPLTLISSLCLLVSAYICRSRGLTPASLLLLFYTICFIAYGVVFDYSLRKSDVFGALGFSYTATPLSEHATSVTSVVFLYAIMAGILAVISTFGQAADRRPVEGRAVSQIPRLTPLQATVAVVFVACYFLGMAWHASAIDWGTLGTFTDYLSLKHPEGLGLTSAPLRIFHFFMKSGSPVLFGAGIFVFAGGRRWLGLALILASLYGFVFNAVTSSRYVVAYPAIVVAISLYRKRYWWSALGLFVLFFLFNMSIVGRGQALHGFSSMSLEFFSTVLSTMPQAGLGLFLNIFDAFIVFGAAVALSPAYYSDYVWLSFSPLPSFLDGFDNVVDTAARISVNVPFSSFAEAYLFGPVALSVHLFVFSLFAVSLQVWARSASVHLWAAALAWMFTVNQLLCQYPIRNSFRFLLLTIVAVGIWHLLRRRGGVRPTDSRSEIRRQAN